MSLVSGTRLGPYEIIAPVGAGGMGEVYRARDTRLDRDVAIKVLPERTARDEQALSRFRRETKALAALSHPNILMILDIGEHEGTSYAVMELLEGETLSQRLQGAGVDARKALEIAAAVADGLAAAHARDIVHRDLKPANLFLTRDGVVKILDFGLARTGLLADPGAATLTATTQPGVVLGTVNYMSPEQVRAESADARSDIFSLGCVLYEMLTGQPPFLQETSAEAMTAILRHHPRPPSRTTADIPADVDPIVMRCLEKAPEDRFHSARDLAFSLRSALSSGAERRAPRRTGVPTWVTVGFVGLMAVGAGVFYATRGRQASSAHPIDSIAVLPFVNASGDPEQEYFVDGMTEALIADLAKIRALKVISRTSAMQFKGVKKPLPEIAEALKVEAVVEGSVSRSGDRVRITAQLIHAPTDKNLWAESYDRDLRDVLSLQSEVARAIAKEIKVTLTPQEQAMTAIARSVIPEAYQAYVKGRYFWNKRTPEAVKKATDYFEEAVRLAPEWPLAYAGLADAYFGMSRWASMPPGEAAAKARAAAIKALELDESSGEAHLCLAWIATTYDWDWPAAEREYKRTLELSPNYATGHQQFALYLLFTGRYDEALQEANKGYELDPLSVAVGGIVGVVHIYAGDFRRAESQFRKVLELDPNSPLARNNLARALVYQARFEEAVVETRKALLQSDIAPRFLAQSGYIFGRAGRNEEARKILDQLAATAEREYVAPAHFALVHVGLDERDRAFEWLEKAYRGRDVWLTQTLTEPYIAPIRSDPRYRDLVRRVGLPPLPPPPKSTSDKPSGEKIMLAVLPFENLSRDPEQEYFSDSLTEEMISQLGRLNPQKLGVIGRSSAMHYKHTERAIEHVRQELGVDFVVEGSVRQAENRVRITAKLIQASDQTQLWTESYDRDLRDILQLQSEVARSIAQEIKVTLTPQEQTRMAAARPVNREAYQAYLKGRFYWNKRTSDGMMKAAEQFELAISLDPDWPLGYAGLADAYGLMPQYAPVRPSEAMPKAKAAAARALEMDKSLAEAHVSLAWIAFLYDWDWPTGEREFERALTLSPNYATGHFWYAVQLSHMGRHDEALREISKAQELDPLSLIIGCYVGRAHYYTGDFAQAENWLRKTLELGPDFARTHQELAKTLLLQGRLAEATTQAREAVRLSNKDPRYVATLGYVYARAGQPEEARRILDELSARSKEAYVASTHFALVHAGLDERDRMFEWLEKAYQEHDSLLLYTLTDPLLAPMRTDPRFADLVRRVGLPPFPQPPKGSSVMPSGEKIMLAVLPFDNLSRDPDQDFFSDGLTEEMIAQLGRLDPKKLGVIGRTSAMRYKGTTKSIDQIGRELGVDRLLEGSVRKAGERLRITAKLLQVRDQTQLWSREFDRTLQDVFAVQAEVAENVARALALELLPETKASLASAPQADPTVHDLYLRGRYAWYRRTPAAMLNGVDYFNQVLERQPDHAKAFAALADSYNELAYHGYLAPHAALPRARAAAQKAVESDDTLAEPHAALAFIAYHYAWDWPTADREFNRAIELNPSCADAHHWLSHFHMSMGRVAESLAASQRALAIDPLEAVLNVHLGWHYLMARQYDLAARQLHETIELDRGMYPAHLHLGRCYLAQGLRADAVSTLEEANRLAPESAQAKTFLAAAYAASGRSSEAQQIIDQLAEAAKTQYVSACDLAAVYAAWGKRDDAFAQLQKALDERSPRLVELTVDPVFDPLRSDPRFDELIRRVGLPPQAKLPSEVPHPRGEKRELTDGKIMLAVLPFENLSRDPEQDYFSDGLTEEMISQMSRLNPKKLGVIARTSAMHYKKTTKTAGAIGRELGVAYIVEGSVRRAGERVRITAQLIQVSDQTHLWAENYERDLKDIFALQSDVAERVAGSLTVELLPESAAASSRARAINPEAYQAYLKGRFYWNKRTPDGINKAVEYFEQSVSLDPAWPLGYAGLADAYVVMPQYASVRARDAIPKAKAAAAKALEIDESLAEAHATLALIATDFDWDWPTAEREYQRALALRPNYATTHHWYARYLLFTGHHDEAIKEIIKAQELDPLSLIIGSVVGMIQFFAGELDQAEAGLRKTLELGPDFPMAHLNLGNTLFLQGRHAEGIVEVRKAVRLSKNPMFAARLGFMCAKAGQREEAKKILDELIAGSAQDYVPSAQLVYVYCGLDEWDRAFEYLEKAFQERDSWLLNSLTDPFLVDMRGDPRFADLVRRVGLPPLNPISPTSAPSPSAEPAPRKP
jgi:eukaryotic-like serine/threonine-protein kinase